MAETKPKKTEEKTEEKSEEKKYKDFSNDEGKDPSDYSKEFIDYLGTFTSSSLDEPNNDNYYLKKWQGEAWEKCMASGQLENNAVDADSVDYVRIATDKKYTAWLIFEAYGMQAYPDFCYVKSIKNNINWVKSKVKENDQKKIMEIAAKEAKKRGLVEDEDAKANETENKKDGKGKENEQAEKKKGLVVSFFGKASRYNESTLINGTKHVVGGDPEALMNRSDYHEIVGQLEGTGVLVDDGVIVDFVTKKELEQAGYTSYEPGDDMPKTNYREESGLESEKTAEEIERIARMEE